jgi:hypothetical protein
LALFEWTGVAGLMSRARRQLQIWSVAQNHKILARSHNKDSALFPAFAAVVNVLEIITGNTADI